MISFSSFPGPLHSSDQYYEGAIHNSDLEDDIDMTVELEDEDFESGGLKLTHPGEVLTSAHAFMR